MNNSKANFLDRYNLMLFSNTNPVFYNKDSRWYGYGKSNNFESTMTNYDPILRTFFNDTSFDDTKYDKVYKYNDGFIVMDKKSKTELHFPSHCACGKHKIDWGI